MESHFDNNPASFVRLTFDFHTTAIKTSVGLALREKPEVKDVSGAKIFVKVGDGHLRLNPLSDMDVSENSGTPKSSILIGFSIINHPFWGTTTFGNTYMVFGFLMIFGVIYEN